MHIFMALQPASKTYFDVLLAGKLQGGCTGAPLPSHYSCVIVMLALHGAVPFLS